jgi:hypothetical protein
MLKSVILFAAMWQAVVSSVNVHLMDANGPIANARVTLTLWSFDVEGNQTIARSEFEDSCKTDRNGACTIVIGETEGVLRGSLDVGEYGKRSLLWPGGAVDVGLFVENGKLLVGTEAGPYDFQKDEPLSLVVVDRRAGVLRLTLTALAALPLLFVLVWVYLQARRAAK